MSGWLYLNVATHFFTEQCRFYTENSLIAVVQLDGFSHPLLYSIIEQLNGGVGSGAACTSRGGRHSGFTKDRSVLKNAPYSSTREWHHEFGALAA